MSELVHVLESHELSDVEMNWSSEARSLKLGLRLRPVLS